MATGFRLDEIKAIEFGVAFDVEGADYYALIPIDNEIRQVARSMLEVTLNKLRALDGGEGLDRYEPAQLYRPEEGLTLPLGDVLCEKVRTLYSAENIRVDTAAIADPGAIKYYYFIFRDINRNKLLAVRRAMQFKGILKARHRIIRLIADTLRINEEPLFKLDADFDWVAFDQSVLILRPAGFQYTAEIDEAILSRAKERAENLQTSIPFLNASRLSEYVVGHKRGARLITSICSQENLAGISQKLLENDCVQNGVELERTDGRIGPAAGFEKAFLELLDRRLYRVELIVGSPERYEAKSRSRRKAP